MDREKNQGTLRPEDYEEPQCLLNMDSPDERKIRMIPQQRVLQKLDDYMARRDVPGAERHLKYWLQEAEMEGDRRGELMIHNEMAGFYRKTGNREEALGHAEKALALLRPLGFEKSVSGGTTYVNAATACTAFGEYSRAMELFSRAKAIYEADPKTRADLLGGLYNNMALACTALKRYTEAMEYNRKALAVMEQEPGGSLEQAITYLNMADTVAADSGMEKGEQQIYEFLDRAEALLNGTDAPKDGYYAFVCEKCAPVFEYYGYFLTAQNLKETAEQIREGIVKES